MLPTQAPLEVKHNMQIWKDPGTGRFKLMDPHGTMYKCDQQGFKKPAFLPKITGFESYRFRVKESLGNRVTDLTLTPLGRTLPPPRDRPGAREGALQVLRKACGKA